jgi:hypothetical protein
MAAPASVALGPDTLQRSVWVVIDPHDVVTGRRMTSRVRARLDGVTAEPIAGLSGVYCFTDLDVAAGQYTARVQPAPAEGAAYFDGETSFALSTVPVAGQPLARNVVVVDLLPRPGYPFDESATLARGRLVRASDGAPVDGARIVLIVGVNPQGIRGRTDERGEFVVPFRPVPPEDTATAGLKNFQFRLRFEIDGQPPLVIAQQTVKEGTTISLHEIAFPGI